MAVNRGNKILIGAVGIIVLLIIGGYAGIYFGRVGTGGCVG